MNLKATNILMMNVCISNFKKYKKLELSRIRKRGKNDFPLPFGSDRQLWSFSRDMPTLREYPEGR